MYYGFLGMHAYWSVFGVFLWVVFFSFMRPMRRASYRRVQSPPQLLQRRYAARENYKRRIRGTAS